MWQKQIESLTEDLEQIDRARAALRTTREIPFVWDIAFVEIFESKKEGFDIVIGNPPYVRQENIADPHLSREDITTENKKEYKTKLARSVYQAFPNFFGYRAETDTAAHKLDAKSDLYIYFYFHGLSLLNQKGSFCFITSNSWLDVGYGKDLQEFLLKHSHIKMILDNQAKRSFAQADINTVIVLLGPPDDRREWALDRPARFVMFKVPFEHILSSIIFDEIETAKHRKNTPEYRTYTAYHRVLLEEGWGWPKDTTDEAKKRFGFSLKGSKYAGNKWGGKYLRAPDIYWVILEKGKGKLVRLGDIAEVRRGITTGANEFFYVDEEKLRGWEIEKDFLKPVIKSPKECKGILIDSRDLRFTIFMCHKERSDLKGTAALEYIKWGESQGFPKRPTCVGRQRWWDLGKRSFPNLNFNYLIDSTAKTLYADRGCYSSDNFQEIHPIQRNPFSLCASLNSTVFQLFVNMAGRSSFGGGLLKIQTYELTDLFCIDPSLLLINNQFLLKGESWDVLDPSPERRAIDSRIFDAIGLAQGEQDAVYEAVTSLVQTRLGKAQSLKPKGHRKRIQAASKTRGIWADLPTEFDEGEQGD